MTDPAAPRHRTLRLVLLAKAGAGLALTVGLLGGFWLRASGLSLEEAMSELGRSPSDPPRFEWRSVDGKHWQALVAPGSTEPAAVTDAQEGTAAGCPAGMVRVKGRYRLELGGEATGEIERLQDAACTDWISKQFPARCRTFDAAVIARETAKLPTRAMDYCIDRFEYPNVRGENPVIVVTFNEAEALCRSDRKRLCTEHEWTFACEGEEARPYPYGFTRDTTACVIDRPWRAFDERALASRGSDKAKGELDRLWQGEPSGSRAGCKSPFGVYDLTGNVDEWTRSARKTGYASILKGGYWGPVRARCRPATRAHGEEFVAYQQGFRCCADATADVPAPPPEPAIGDRVDAGPPPVTLTGPEAGADGVASDLEPERTILEPPPEDDDELGALRKAATGLSCAASPPAPSGAAGAAAALVAAAGLAALRRRRRAW